MKALILAGGRGKRMESLAAEKNKCMIEVNGKPLIEYSLDCAVNSGVDEIVILVGYRAEDIVNRFGSNYKGKRVQYAVQGEQKGLVHAIESAASVIGKEDFMLLLGDEFMVGFKHLDMIEKYKKEGVFAMCGVVEVKDLNLVKKTYSVIQGHDGKIFRLVEKPENPMDNIMGTGNIIFKNEILSYIPKTPINQKRGEKELPDLIQCAVDDGKIVKSFRVCDSYVNVNDPEEMKKITSHFAHLSS